MAARRNVQVTKPRKINKLTLAETIAFLEHLAKNGGKGSKVYECASNHLAGLKTK